jgi:hypothetical protein
MAQNLVYHNETQAETEVLLNAELYGKRTATSTNF